jgi:gamma-glutamylcyclotransferase (GGCT)/AIG2-like uncharacterized protein YtfP
MVSGRSIARQPALVPGTLYDTGNGWPAAVFGPTPTRRSIPGWVIWLEGPTIGALLGELDEMEGIGVPPDPATDPYERIRVHVDGVTPAWAYHATRVEPGWRAIDSWLDQPEA